MFHLNISISLMAVVMTRMLRMINVTTTVLH